MSETIKIRDVNAIRALDIELQPGITVLQGRNGSGKSSALNGISQLLGSEARNVNARDNTTGGSISLGSTVLRVTRSKSRSSGGALVVDQIEDRFQIVNLVNPPEKGAEAADSTRMKALISLSGREATPADFLELCDNDQSFYDALGIAESKETLTQAARVKGAFEKAARGYESEAEKLGNRAAAGSLQLEGVDLTVETNENKLAQAFADASATVATMKSHNEQCELSARAAETAQRELASLSDDIDKPVELDAEARRLTAQNVAVREEMAIIQKQIDDLKSTMESALIGIAENDKQIAELARRKAVANRALFRRDQLAQAAAESVPTPHSQESIEAAQAAADAARRDIELAGIVRRLLTVQQTADDDARAAKAKAEQGEDMRRRAQAVDAVLTKFIPQPCPLRYEMGRLVIETPRSKSTLFADLSQGERWRIAIQIAASQLGENGLLPLVQEAYEALDPDNRAIVHAEAVAQGLAIITAEATDGELRAVAFATED